jgi:Zn-dependent alcohol dehydrogenase
MYIFNNGSLPVKTPIILGHECPRMVSNIGKEVKYNMKVDIVKYRLSGKAHSCEKYFSRGRCWESDNKWSLCRICEDSK